MGKIVLISGSNGSGKSRFAENLVVKIQNERYYIATMISQTHDNELRIQKHQKQREGLGFITLELPYQVGDTAISENSSVLLEDVSNLLANVLFERGGKEEDVYRDILNLAQRCRILFAVTISGLRPEVYEGMTAAYICALNQLNQSLFEQSAAAVKMIDGTPQWQKGDLYALDSILLDSPVHLQRGTCPTV